MRFYRARRFLVFALLVVFSPNNGRPLVWGVVGHSMSHDGASSRRRASILQDAKAFHAYAAASVELSNAHVGGSTTSHHVLTVTRSVRDIDQGKRRQYLYTIPLATQPLGKPLILPPVELPDTVLARIPSPSGDKIAIFRHEPSASSLGDKNGQQATNNTNKPPQQQVLEVWSRGGLALLRRIALPTERLHGQVIFDTMAGFGKPCWNAQETALVYMAERKAPPTASFFDGQFDVLMQHQQQQQQDDSQKGNGDTDKDDAAIRGAQSTLGLGKTEKWGEKYVKQSALLDLLCVNVETGRLEKVQNCPGATSDNKGGSSTEGSFTLGQPVFSPDGMSIVYTAWDAGGGSDMPRRLGLIYCQQRPSSIHVSSIENLMERLATTTDETSTGEESSQTDGAPICLTPQSRLSRSPRFSPTDETTGTSKLVFLCSDRGFNTHSGCFSLQAMDWKDKQPVPSTRCTLVKEVWNPNESPASAGSVMGLLFPGLFLLSLPESPFLSSEYLLTTTQWGSSSRIVRVSLRTGELKVISTGEKGHYSDSLLFASLEGGVVFQTAAPNRVPTLWHVPASALIESTNLVDADKMALDHFFPVASSKYSNVPESPALDFNCDIQLLSDLPKVDGVKVDGIPVHTILLMPDLNKHPCPPLIVVPHGGPHSVSSTNYVPSLAYICGRGGYAVALVNYRGSTGFGQELVDSLPTRIGKLDVEDMVAATLKIRESGLVDPNRIGICGGSHGGFLTGHCTGQHPDLFRVAAMRNPVVNIPSMTTATDIPDWCFVEAVGSYDWQDYRPPTRTELQIMWEKSPIRYIQNVKAPTLVALGLKDLRVPPSQGLEWFYTLRAKGVPSKLITYDNDDHAIAGAQAEADHWINIKRWFDEHLVNRTII